MNLIHLKAALLPLCLMLAGPTVFAQGGDNCANPTVLVGLAGDTFDNTTATTSGFQGGNTCPGSVSQASQDLFWKFTVPANGHYFFNTLGSSFDTVLKVYDGGDCTAQCLGANDNSFLLQSEVRLTNLRGGQELLIQVGGYTSPFPSQGPEFGAGVLTIGGFLDSCVGVHYPDYLEESDACGEVLALGDGNYPELSVSWIDPDFYELEVPPGGTLFIDVFATLQGGDLSIILWDATNTCRGSDLNQAVDRSANNSFTGTYDEWIVYTNPGAAPVNMILEVRMESMNGCNPYELQLVGSSGPNHQAAVGTAYCDAVPNSSGEVANLWALGSDAAADNNLELVAASVPANSFGFFLVSTQSGFTPLAGGSEGNLCLSGNIGRYVAPGQVQNSGPSGQIDLVLDLMAVPQPTGPISAAPGDTLYFQLWSRDSAAGVATSNFSHGVEVVLQ